MKYLDFRLYLPDRMLHPMQAFIREEDAVGYEEMLAWRVRSDEGIEYEEPGRGGCIEEEAAIEDVPLVVEDDHEQDAPAGVDEQPGQDGRESDDPHQVQRERPALSRALNEKLRQMPHRPHDAGEWWGEHAA